MKDNTFYDPTATYIHNELKYTAKYIGRGYRNKHGYEVIDPKDSGFSKGTQFTPNEPEKYFQIL